jgi:membrane-bound lytic murein transglycosylase D
MMTFSRSMLTGFALASSVLVAPSQGALNHMAVRGAQLAAAAALDAPAEAEAGEFTPSIPPADNFTGPHNPDTDARLGRSDAQFNNGRQAYFRGDLQAAHREFDAAVDTLLSAPDSISDHARIERRLDELCDQIYRFDVEKLGSGKTDEASVVFDKAPIDEISHMTFSVDPSLIPRVKLELNQTTSGIPLELADPVLAYVHYFQTDAGRRTLLAGFRRAGRYKDLIQRIFAEEGVPQELIYLAQAESGFLPRAVSYKSAAGMWQFISGTGTLYQLERTSVYDERFDPEKATRAAAKYLKDLYAHYKDWYLAMAAYNCGAGAIDRAIERTGYADYWELLKRHALPKETSNYVPIIVAMTIMAKNPQDYGLENIDSDPAVEFDTLRVTAPTNLNLIADAVMQPVSVIRDLNPALLKTVAPTGFLVNVPKGSADSAKAALNTVPAGNRQAWRLHHVLAGDTLAGIARSYHLTPERIASVNRISDSIEAGDVLLIPALFHEEHQPLRKRSRGAAPVQRASHLAASRHIPASTFHRKAAIRTASLED